MRQARAAGGAIRRGGTLLNGWRSRQLPTCNRGPMPRGTPPRPPSPWPVALDRPVTGAACRAGTETRGWRGMSSVGCDPRAGRSGRLPPPPGLRTRGRGRARSQRSGPSRSLPTRIRRRHQLHRRRGRPPRGRAGRLVALAPIHRPCPHPYPTPRDPNVPPWWRAEPRRPATNTASGLRAAGGRVMPDGRFGTTVGWVPGGPEPRRPPGLPPPGGRRWLVNRPTRGQLEAARSEAGVASAVRVCGMLGRVRRGDRRALIAGAVALPGSQSSIPSWPM